MILLQFCYDLDYCRSMRWDKSENHSTPRPTTRGRSVGRSEQSCLAEGKSRFETCDTSRSRRLWHRKMENDGDDIGGVPSWGLEAEQHGIGQGRTGGERRATVRRFPSPTLHVPEAGSGKIRRDQFSSSTTRDEGSQLGATTLKTITELTFWWVRY